MNIKKLMEVICDELKWNEALKGHRNPKADLVYYNESERAFLLRDDLSISIFSDDAQKTYEIEKMYNIDHSSFDIELFTAIDSIIRNVSEYKEHEYIDVVKKCAARVRLEIKCKLNFNDIQQMSDLKDSISKDNLYSTLYFIVKRYKCRKKDQYISYNTKPTTYCFGNVEYSRNLDKVNIEIFNDFISLHYQNNGSMQHESSADNTGKSDELCILHALDLWRGYYD